MEENQEIPEKVEDSPSAELPDSEETIEIESGEDATPEAEGDLPVEEIPKEESFETQLLENPQLYSTNYLTDDYAITLIHDFTLGDVLISTLLCVLIIVQVLKSVLGGGRSW